MQINITLPIDIDPAEFAALHSEVDADGRRHIQTDIVRTGQLLLDRIGVKAEISFRVKLDARISRAEVAAVLGMTEEQVAAIPVEQAEQQAPFVEPFLTKIQAALDPTQADAWAAQYPDSPWDEPDEEETPQ